MVRKSVTSFRCVVLKSVSFSGWRTSGKILYMQTAAMQFHTPLEYSFVDAPFPAEGPPDEGIATYYPNKPYFEWFKKRPTQIPPYEGIDESVALVVDYLKKNGPFEGIMGFSQGAAMATRLAYLQEKGDKSFEGLSLFKFVILIGGVPPIEISEKVSFLCILQ